MTNNEPELFKDVDQPSPEFNYFREKCQMSDDLWGGTEAMREAGKRYLPQDKAELDHHYAARIQLSTLTNFFKTTVQKLTGKVFTRDIRLIDYDQQVVEWCENIDLQNRDLTQFARPVFTDGVKRGVTYILTEMQVSDIPLQTRLDEKLANLRPYLVHIPSNKMLDLRVKLGANGYEPSLVRFIEEVTEEVDDFRTRSVRQVKVIKIGTYQIYREKMDDLGKGTGEWFLHASGNTGLDVIPITAFVTNHTGFMMGLPPLQDLAEKNVEHWQKTSDLSNIMHFANVPVLFYAGPLKMNEKGEEETIVIGPNALVTSPDPTAKLTPVEHSGHAIGKAMDYIKMVVDEITMLGQAPMKTIQRTATEAGIDHQEDNSLLMSWATKLEDTLEQNILYMDKYDKVDRTKGSLDVNKDFGFAESMATDFNNVLELYDRGVGDQKDLMKEAIRYGVLDQDTNTEEVSVRVIETPAKNNTQDKE